VSPGSLSFPSHVRRRYTGRQLTSDFCLLSALPPTRAAGDYRSEEAGDRGARGGRRRGEEAVGPGMRAGTVSSAPPFPASALAASCCIRNACLPLLCPNSDCSRRDSSGCEHDQVVAADAGPVCLNRRRVEPHRSPSSLLPFPQLAEPLASPVDLDSRLSSGPYRSCFARRVAFQLAARLPDRHGLPHVVARPVGERVLGRRELHAARERPWDGWLRRRTR
jgi:hypothetical protein